MNVRAFVRQTLLEAFNTSHDTDVYLVPSDVRAVANSAFNSSNGGSVNRIDNDPNEGSGEEFVKTLMQQGSSLTFNQMQKLKTYFDKHSDSLTSENNILAWNLHGGNACRDWVNKEMEKEKKSSQLHRNTIRKAGGAGADDPFSVHKDGSGGKGKGILDYKKLANPFHNIKTGR